jgi:3alpha(or 20beta)-hydroxysteroid dehydrogenase
MARLANKIAIITGAAHGQGAAEARLFVAESAAVVLTDIDKAGAELAEQISREGGKAKFIHHDVRDENGWIDLVASVKSWFGALHILINNAGVTSRQGILNTTLPAWHRTIDVNLMGPMLGMKYCAPLLRDSGGGSIVNVSSTGGLLAHYDGAYGASKWGLRGLTKTAAIELVEWKIRVNSIHPAQILDTSFFRDGAPGHSESARQTIPMQRQGTPQECANLALFLASDEASFITGAEVAIDGGFSAGASIWMRSKLRDQLAAQGKG